MFKVTSTESKVWEIFALKECEIKKKVQSQKLMLLAPTLTSFILYYEPWHISNPDIHNAWHIPNP